MTRLLLAFSLVALNALAQGGLTYRVIDKDGVETMLTGIDLDYSNYPGSFGTYTPDHEQAGIRVLQGSGRTTVAWDKIKSLLISLEVHYFVRKKCGDEMIEVAKEQWEEARKGACFTSTQDRYSGQLQLAAGQTLAVSVVSPSRPLSGESVLGKFEISLSSVRRIDVVKAEK